MVAVAGLGRLYEAAFALGELLVQRHTGEMRAHHCNLHCGFRFETRDGLRGGKRMVRRTLHQACAVVVALAQICQLPIAASWSDQGDAKRQLVGANFTGNRECGVVKQVDEVGVVPQVFVELNRVGLHLADRVVRGRGGDEQHIDRRPHFLGGLLQSHQLGFCLAVVGGTKRLATF